MSSRRKIIYWIVGIYLGITVLENLNPDEPEERIVYRTKTVTETKTEVVKKPYVPAACIRALDVASDVGTSATEIADVTNLQLDLMHRAGKFVHSRDMQGLVDSGNQQRELETQISKASRTLFTTLPEYKRAKSACKDAISE